MYGYGAPDAHFWVGTGARPGPDGTVVPDENGATKPLKRYDGKTIVITLPDHLTVFDIDYLSVWCKAFFSDFGNVKIPDTLNVPPSLKMLGVAPQVCSTMSSAVSQSPLPIFCWASFTHETISIFCGPTLSRLCVTT